MPTIDIIKETEISNSIRCQQVQSMFDVPIMTKEKLEWSGSLPIDGDEWNIGLIVGPSGCGKSIIAKDVFGDKYEPAVEWNKKSVIDEFNDSLSVEEIARVCSAVGFNTTPAWLRPFKVLSNGEKFRVEIARRLLELENPIVVDEFTSVVDRQVAKIACYAIQKFVRKNNKRFVGVSCHYDIIDWLQPDWIFEPATMEYKPRGCLQQRPELKGEIRKVSKEYWRIFSPYHYLDAGLHPRASCYVLFIDDRPTSFVGILHLPTTGRKNLKRMTRGVTLPDWQGLGLIFYLIDNVAAAYKALGYILRGHSAHPTFIRSVGKNKNWKLIKKPRYNSGIKARKDKLTGGSCFAKKKRPVAVYEYCGVASNKETARKLTGLKF